MDEILAQLFPQAPSYFPGLLGQEQANLLQQQAQRQGLLGIGMGLLQAAAPSTTRPSLGAGIAQGLATGQQMAQNVYAQRLQEQQIAQKLAEQQRQLQQRETMRRLFPQVFQQTVERGAVAGEEGPIPTAQPRVSIDPQKLSMLAMASDNPLDALSNIGKTVQQLRQAGLTTGAIGETDPFTPFLASDNENIRNMAANYSRSFRTGALDEPAINRAVEVMSKMLETAGKPSSLRADYEYAMADRRKRGQPETPFEQWAIQQAQAKAIQVNLPAQREEMLFAKVDLQRVQDFSNAAASSREFAQATEAINRLLEGKGGGQAVKVGTDIQRFLGIQSDTVTADDLARSLATRAATTVRAPGSGETSNLEFNAYLQAVPTLQNSQEGRSLMAAYSRARAQRDAKLADFARGLARKDQFSEESIAAFDESLGPVMSTELQRKFMALTRRDFRQGAQ